MVTYDANTQSFHCDGCEETFEIRRDVAGDPEALFDTAEMVSLDHAECASYRDVRMAKLARKFRKAAKRQALLAAHRQGRPMPCESYAQTAAESR